MTEPTWDRLVPEDWLVVAVASVTVNVCWLIRGLVSRAVLVSRRIRRRRHASTLTDCENAIRRPPPSNNAHDDVLVSALTEMLLCSTSVTLGLIISASESMTTTPLSGLAHRPTLTLLSIALGRFIFTFVHLIGHPGIDLAWTLFRAIYVTVSAICLSVVVLTGDNLIVAVMILLLELGMAVEEASRVVERTATASARVATAARNRLERVLTLLSLLLVSVIVPIPLILLVVAICSLQRSFLLSPPEFGLLCFALLFYSLTAAFLFFLRRLRYRCRLAVLRSPKFPTSTIMSSQEVQLRRRPPVGAVSCIDRKRRRTVKRADVEFLLHAVRGARVCSVDVFNVLRIAAASGRRLPDSNRSQVTSTSAS